MKTKPSQASRAENNGIIQSKQVRKTAEASEQNGGAPTHQWKPDRKWHTEQRRAYELMKRLANMERPRMIAKDAQYDQSLWFARDSAGKELFFLEQPKFQYPGERMLKSVSRKDAFNLLVAFNMPPCLYDYMIAVLKKGGVW